jgi:hypothetical protein
VSSSTIALKRLYQQRLSQNPLASPEEVVGWLGAVQSQEYLGALWSLGLRTQGATDDAIERAFDEGAILRTHVMRPTWHFVTPADIRWLLELTAPRVRAASAYGYRRFELDEALLSRSVEIIAGALEGGRYLARAELGEALAKTGIEASGTRLAHIAMWAELEAVVCSGPRRGKQFTYALLAERAPGAARLSRDEALAELARRYFTGHGPATPRDFAWWSGLTLADARDGVELAAPHLGHEVIDGELYWFSASELPSAEPCSEGFLLPTFDEYLVGYDGFDRARRGGQDESAVAFLSPLVIGGRIVGSWRRTFSQGEVVVEVAPFDPLTAGEAEAVAAAARRYSEFLGLPLAG